MLRNAISLSAAMLLTMTMMCSESRAVTIDGIVGAGEYAQGFATDLSVEGTSTVLQGELWLSQNGSNVSMAFVQPVTLVDNSYGTNSIGWGSNAPSGKNHNFSDLLNSDKLELSVLDSGGSALGSIELDYLAKVGPNYQAVVVTGKDFNGKVTAFESSLDYNLNVVAGGNTTVGGVNLLNHSPEVNQTTGYPATVTTPGLSAWEYAVVYEFTLSNPGFTVDDLISGNVTLGGPSGHGGSSGSGLPLFHDSPNKIGKNKVTEPPDFGSPLGPSSPPAVPEPSSLVLLLIGSVGLLTYRVRRRRSPPASISAT